jgi:ribosomal protein L40E
MTSICPHCNQKYDISEEYLQEEVVCENCGQNFIVLKAKFCTGCGTVNHTKSVKCRKCEDQLAPRSQTVATTNAKPLKKIEHIPDTPLALKSTPSHNLTLGRDLKTVCSHCYQNYDVSPDLLNQEVVCENCLENFTVTRAKTCPICGFLNPAQAFNCWSCQKPFQIEFEKEPSPVKSIRNQEEENKSPKSNWEYTIWWPGVLIWIIYMIMTNCNFEN